MMHALAISLLPDFDAGIREAIAGTAVCECVVAAAKNAEQALQYLETHECELVLLDARDAPWHAESTVRLLMSRVPVPILLCTNDGAADGLQAAIDAGAVAVARYPKSGVANPATESFCQTMRLVSEITVVRRHTPPAPVSSTLKDLHPRYESEKISVVAIGASAGGTTALRSVLSRIRVPLAVPIIVVQHISEGHVHGLARWLNEQTQLTVQVAEDRLPAKPGHVYLAPDDRHLGIDSGGVLRLNDGEKVKGLRPAIGRMFDAVQQAYGAGAIAVLLSGMGDDGAQAMRNLYQAGAMTIVQDKETSLIHGIPGEAIRLSAARLVLGLDDIGPAVNAYVDRYARRHLLAAGEPMEDQV